MKRKKRCFDDVTILPLQWGIFYFLDCKNRLKVVRLSQVPSFTNIRYRCSQKGDRNMSFRYDKDYFITANPAIVGNDELRDPQIMGYSKVYEHFVVKNKKTHAIVVLPTGVGKTGLIGLLPYHICKGKLLIITPQLTIKDTVIDSLDPENPESFWYKRKIFRNVEDTPVLIEYNSTTTREILDSANIVILNIHKLQPRLDSSPLNFLNDDYFDMIIIDEAHHSTANTWVATTEYFDRAKVVKLTGTPIRTDGVDMAGELVYKYKLSQAMAKGYVKSLRNLEYIPGELRLTIDNDESKEYTVEEILEQGLRDEDWIRRSVAFSKVCSTSVVEESLRILENKRKDTSVPHKIIAVACSISHAEQIKDIYIQKGFIAKTIHSKQEPYIQEEVKSDIENHRLDAVINVAMLGEGYDHPYLSVAAIFRPFRSVLQYEQFIGRVLRIIPSEEAQKVDDNIADIVSHRNLQLDELWQRYKIELQESDVIKHLQEENILDIDESDPDCTSTTGTSGNVILLGKANEAGQAIISRDYYLDTELVKKHKEEEMKQQEAIEKLKELLNVDSEQATAIYNQTRTKDTAAIKRPDLYFAGIKKNLDTEIREVIVPEIIANYNIVQTDNDLAECRLFLGKYAWIKTTGVDNGGLLAMYFNTYLKGEIGKSRDQWTTSDYDNAFNKLSVVREYIEKVIADYMQE